MKQPSSQSPDTSRLTLHTALVIFAKAPIPGEVKTRLCPPLTPDEAATLHGSFVLDMLERSKLAVAKLQLPFHRYLACSPSSELVFFKIMEERQNVHLLDQIGEDLGQRMHRTSVDLFAKGYKHVIIVGTDIPTLPLSVYQEAFALLGRSDVVLGPAIDGGYYLIGLKQPTEKLFTGVPWSTDQVLAVTQQKAKTLGLSVGLTTAWRDVDTIADLQSLTTECQEDNKKPKQDRTFSMRTAGTLQLLATRLKTR
ncbi:MAG: TIGR04282 family arsenosugar biosynthesis glycosyltransferase [Nitrospirota bacterium]|nr:TIGR04282 family arsenosugar biosynthesis glycosyltransferase [Nitrospirota bacterium]MDP2382290.1 TIGR04282 family arsenosugar biosynthesis glycosyltransferase [Nitrospirota bacterium]